MPPISHNIPLIFTYFIHKYAYVLTIDARECSLSSSHYYNNNKILKINSLSRSSISSSWINIILEGNVFLNLLMKIIVVVRCCCCCWCRCKCRCQCGWFKWILALLLHSRSGRYGNSIGQWRRCLMLWGKYLITAFVVIFI